MDIKQQKVSEEVESLEEDLYTLPEDQEKEFNNT
jgi:hypothetical protein